MTEGLIVSSYIPLFAILCPATAAILILLSGKRPNVRESWTIIAGILQFSLIASMIPTILDEKVVECLIFRQTMFIFFEILTMSTYPLVIHDQSKEALSAGHKYFAYLLTVGVFLLFAIMMTYYRTGTTDFTNEGIVALAELGPGYKRTLIILFFCFLLGFMKAAWMPFHSWLPTAMIAPTPVSALLHAVAVVKAGVFGIVRIVCYIYGVDLMTSLGLGIALACIAGFTMIVANLFAIAQDNLKRRLAYSTINQLSYIILGTALLTQDGIRGAMMHIPFHGFMKITLFLCAGAIMVVTGKKNISEMAGIGKTMPVTMLAFTITAFGMCGIPPVVGFISKWYLCMGSYEAFQEIAVSMGT